MVQPIVDDLSKLASWSCMLQYSLDKPRQDQAVGTGNPTNATETLNPVFASFTLLVLI